MRDVRVREGAWRRVRATGLRACHRRGASVLNSCPRWTTLSIILLLGQTTNVPMAAADTTPVRAWPPFDYRLDNAIVRVQLLPAHGLPQQTLTLPGAGLASFIRDGATVRFTPPANELLATINELYRMRFFDLPDRLLPTRSMFVKQDGALGTQAMKMHDALTTRVCFALPKFEKCVTYEADPPLELERLVQRLLADARQLTTPVGYTK